MAERIRKEATPPPLLLMPASGGLTLNPPEQPNILMPVIQSEASLLCPEDEAEADSFVGQNLSESTNNSNGQHASPFPMFQQSSSASLDPFSQIGHHLPPGPLQTVQKMDFPTVSSSAPTVVSQMGAPPQNMHPEPIPTSMATPRNSFPVWTRPPMESPEVSNVSTNRYRQKGPLRYAPPPPGTYSAPPPPNSMNSPISSQIGPPPQSGQVPVSTFMPPPPTRPPMLESPPNSQPLPATAYPAPANINGAPYQPVPAHWCFCKRIENREVWFPFSIADSIRMENVFQKGSADSDVVATDGGRYDVHVGQRLRKAVYWDEDPTHVRRSTWFYKREGDNKYVPYAEVFAQKLEEEYRNAILNNVWHKRLEFPGGETIVMHNPNVIVHFQASSQPDEWGTIQLSPSNHESPYVGLQSVYTLPGDQMRPRVVKRGIDDFATVLDGEAGQIDHVVFIVHGIGPVCDIRFRSIVECVDDFRSISLNLLQSHFSDAVKSGRIGRVEFLPVHWHTTLHGEATGIDRRLKAITLPSTGKLRHFINDTLLDILFYTSPKYCQTMCDTVGSEINRLYKLFLSRNPSFQGTMSVAGHSLGSSILFDLLLHQHDPLNSPDSENKSKDTSPEPTAVENMELSLSDENTEDQQLDMTLEELLAKVGLQDKMKIFKEEQMDIDSLTMCSDADLKDLGLPMGPRKKLQMMLREEEQKKVLKKEAAMKALVEVEKRKKEEERKSKADEVLEKMLKSQTSVSVDYLMGMAGTGQPSVEYPQLLFQPINFFALGSPIGVFLAVRGVEKVGEEFRLPTCPRVFNIFHPFDPVAYRLEPLVNPNASNHKPVLMPHHKGRKRLHLELRESLTRVGADLKQKIIESLKSTWNSINEFARAHTTSQSLEQQVDKEVNDVISQLTVSDDDRAETASIASSHDEEFNMGQLNEGRRIDFVLQEKPIESFNDYLFALASHGCYWESEDTVLLVLKELYTLNGIKPQMPWPDSTSRSSIQLQSPPLPPPPMGGIPPLTSPQQSLYPASGPLSDSLLKMAPSQHPEYPNHIRPPSMGAPPAGFPPMGPPTGPPNPSTIGPPPLTGFMKTFK